MVKINLQLDWFAKTIDCINKDMSRVNRVKVILRPTTYIALADIFGTQGVVDKNLEKSNERHPKSMIYWGKPTCTWSKFSFSLCAMCGTHVGYHYITHSNDLVKEVTGSYDASIVLTWQREIHSQYYAQWTVYYKLFNSITKRNYKTMM